MASTLIGLAVLLALWPAVAANIFIVNCLPLTVQRGDPIVSPGQISAHVHSVVGGTAFALSESNDEARASPATTCNMVLDHSNYWQPQLYHQAFDGSFELVTMEGITAYYLNRACDFVPGRQACAAGELTKAPPADLRMVVGNPYLRSYDAFKPEQRAISHHCLRDAPSGVPGQPWYDETPHLPARPCKRLRA